MSDLSFSMGKFDAHLPSDRHYCRNHMWVRPEQSGLLRFGFTAYALRLMQDVYFLEWSVNVGDAVALKQHVGNIETSKAVSDLFAPLSGTMQEINQEVLKDPSKINVDCYSVGWLFEMRGDDVGTMSVQEYFDFLSANWEQTQRILKGQMGE